jgi:hypothetical protein
VGLGIYQAPLSWEKGGKPAQFILPVKENKCANQKRFEMEKSDERRDLPAEVAKQVAASVPGKNLSL